MNTQHPTPNAQKISLRYKKLWLLVFCVASFFNSKLAKSQVGGMATVLLNDSIREMFSKLEKPLPPHPQADANYDFAIHFSDSSWWVHKNLDTNFIDNWYLLYEELWFCQYDTSIFDDPVHHAYHSKHKYGSDTVPIMLINYNFYEFKDDAFNSDKYFAFGEDQYKNYLVDNYKIKFIGNSQSQENDPNYYTIDPDVDGDVENDIWQNDEFESPYLHKNIFTVSLRKELSTFRRVTYALDRDLFMVDSYNQTDLESKLWLDFGDGQGWRNYPLGAQPTFVTIEYPDSGVFAIQAAISESEPAIEITTTDTSLLQVERYAKTFQVVSTAQLPVAPSLVWNENNSGVNSDITVGVYDGCPQAIGFNNPEKYLIYLEGFDALDDENHEDMYAKLFRFGIADLRNHGYTILTVNFENNTQDMRKNADAVISLINHLKCNVIPGDEIQPEQFVVIGTSMGGQIARYALRSMEVDPSKSTCHPEWMHNTRLYISFDSPNQGAYMAMALQHLASNFTLNALLLTANAVADNFDQANILYSEGAKQLLNRHVGPAYPDMNALTNLVLPWPVNNIVNSLSNSNAQQYFPHAARVAFMNDLTALGNNGYPQFCKLYGISNGLLGGETQVRKGNSQLMQDGDSYLDVEGRVDAWLLGLKLNMLAGDFNLRAIDGSGAKPVYNLQLGTKVWKPYIKRKYITKPIRIRIFGRRITISKGLWIPDGFGFKEDYLISIGSQESTPGMYCWDKAPGGYYGYGQNVGDIIDNANFEGDWGLRIGNFRVAAVGASLDVGSTLDKFGFIPTISALDYNTTDPELDILGKSTASKMNDVPFDVISGRGAHPNYPNLQFEDDRFSWNGFHIGSSMQNYLVNETDSLLQNGRPQLVLNREIGEDVLYLENWRINRNATITVNGDMVAGVQNNPYYEYPNRATMTLAQDFDNFLNASFANSSNYIFSDDAPFSILNQQLPNPPQVELAHHVNDFTDNGVQGTYTLLALQNALSCNSVFDLDANGNPEFPDYRSARAEVNEQIEEQEMQPFAFYPNPVENHLQLQFPFEETQEVELEIYTLDGKLIDRQQKAVKQFWMLDLSGLPQGMYVLNVQAENFLSNAKIYKL